MEAAIASTLTNMVLEKLRGLVEEVQAKRGKEWLQDTELLIERLQVIQESLSAAEHHVVEVDNKLLKQIKELSYDVDDGIDELRFDMVERVSAQHESKGLIDRTKKLVTRTKTRHRIANRLHELRCRVMEVSKKVSELQLVIGKQQVDTAVSSTSSVSSDARHLALFADPLSLVGVDGPRDELAKLLMEKESESAERLKVVSIVGSGGLGKTTLAREVYSTTKEYFECGAWVSVSVNPNVKKILIHIFDQFEDSRSSKANDDLDERDLIRKIKEYLQNKRYILVLDDIWSSETWEIMKSCLPLNNFGSRVITTTRLNNVALSCCSHWNDYIYTIKPLSEVDSRKLFLRRIFGNADSCPQHLVDVSDKIFKKCSGFPLAINAMSSLLANKPHTSSVWEDVYNSVGATVESMEGMKNIFLLSYYDLPHHLKICFLYLSIFPEDYVINRDRIVRRWIAEGFILGKHGKTLEEEGESYLNELINRHMIQPLYDSYDGKPEAYRIHDIMLGLIRSKSIEENFVTLSDSDKPVSALHRKVRWLSIINVKEDHYILETMNTSHTRSLSIFGNVGPRLSFEHFTFLRVLDLEGCKDLKAHNMEEIAGLIYLRYLSIRDTSISKLPDQIGKLQYLTTLDLQGSNIQELPIGVSRLQRLTHLHCDKMRFPEWIGKMEALSWLSQFDILQSKLLAVKELGNLSELRELVLWWFPDIESNNTKRYDYLAFSLYRLDKLQALYIRGGDSSVDFLDHLRHPLRQLRSIQLNSRCYLNRIPEWFRSLPSLSFVCIDIKEVKNHDLQFLSQLPSLRHLSLSSRAMPTEKLVISSNGFSILQEFHLHSVRADLTFEPHAMQKLEKLMVSFHVLPEETCGFSEGIEEMCGFSICIDQFKCLKKIDINIHGEGAAASKLFEAANVAIRKSADEHPNHPIVNIITLGNLVDNAAKEGKEKEQKLEPIKDYAAMEGNEKGAKSGTDQSQIL